MHLIRETRLFSGRIGKYKCDADPLLLPLSLTAKQVY